MARVSGLFLSIFWLFCSLYSVSRFPALRRRLEAARNAVDQLFCSMLFANKSDIFDSNYTWSSTHFLFKDAQMWNFQSVGLSWFLHYKVSSWWPISGLKLNLVDKISSRSFRAAKLLTSMLTAHAGLSLMLRGKKCWVWPYNIFGGIPNFWDYLLVSIIIFLLFYFFQYFKTYAYDLAFMRMLSIRIRNLYVH